MTMAPGKMASSLQGNGSPVPTSAILGRNANDSCSCHPDSETGRAVRRPLTQVQCVEALSIIRVNDDTYSLYVGLLCTMGKGGISEYVRH